MRVRAPRVVAVLVAAGLSMVASRAGADLAPPRGFVETCTQEKQAKPGKECLTCSAYFGNPEHCAASLASYGFAQGCRSGGASNWSEVWCRAASPAAAKVPPEVLGQLDNPSKGLRPATSGAPAASGAPVASAAPAASGAPLDASPAPVDTNAPAPQPVPPAASGCACTTGRAAESLPLLMLGISVAAAGIARRRRRG